MHSKLKVFYWDSYEDKGVSRDTPIELTVDDAIEYMEVLSDSDGSFLGLKLPDGVTIQFMYNENHSIHLDIPDVLKGGSYAKEVDIEQCLQIIRDIYAGKKPMEIEGLEFDSW